MWRWLDGDMATSPGKSLLGAKSPRKTSGAPKERLETVNPKKSDYPHGDLGFPRIFLARNHRKIWEHHLIYGDLMVI
jgi:hypothetical protein